MDFDCSELFKRSIPTKDTLAGCESYLNAMRALQSKVGKLQREL